MNNTREFYENYYLKHSWKTSLLKIKLKAKVFLKIIRITTNIQIKKILYAGCGTGIYTKIFSDLGYECDGFDFSQTAISSAIENYPNNKFTCQDARKLNYDKKFDLIFSNGLSLFNTYDFDQAWQVIDYWKSFLTKNGIILIIGRTNFIANSIPGWITHTEDEIIKMFKHDDFINGIYFLNNTMKYILLIPFIPPISAFRFIDFLTKTIFIKSLKKIQPSFVIMKRKNGIETDC
jgi:SAM-dependent methyltransferase